MKEKDGVINNKKKKGLKVLLILFGILILITILFIIFMKKVLTAEYFIERSSKKIGNYISLVQRSENYKTKFSFAKNYARFKGNATINTDMNNYNYLNNLGIDFKYIVSLKDEYMDLFLDLKQNEASLPINFYLTNNNLYIDSKDLNINLLGLPLEENPFIELKQSDIYNLDINTDNVLYSLDKLVLYFKEALKEGKLETINNGSTFKYKYIVDNTNNDSAFIKKFIELIKEDEKLRKSLLLEEDFDKEYFDNSNYISYFTLEIIHSPLKNSIDGIKFDYKEKINNEEQNGFIYYEKIDNNNYKISSNEGYLTIESKNDKLIVNSYDNKKLVMKLELLSKEELNIKLNIYLENDNELEIVLKGNNLSFNNAEFNGYVNLINKDGSFKVNYQLTEEILDDSVNKENFKNASSFELLSEEDTKKITNAYNEKIKQFEFLKIYNELQDLKI